MKEDTGEKLPPPCPACGGHLRVEYRLRAKPIGTFSLAGAQPKVVAENWPWVVCDGCGVEAEAEVSGRTVSCRKCGQPIEGDGFGSPETGWEHPFTCPHLGSNLPEPDGP